MRPALEPPILELMDKLRSAMRTGRKLHLSQEHIQILLQDQIYRNLAQLEANEMRNACAHATANDNKLGSIGSGSGQTQEPGASAGLKDEPTAEATSRGARQRLLEEVSQIARRKPLRMR